MTNWCKFFTNPGRQRLVCLVREKNIHFMMIWRPGAGHQVVSGVAWLAGKWKQERGMRDRQHAVCLVFDSRDKYQWWTVQSHPV